MCMCAWDGCLVQDAALCAPNFKLSCVCGVCVCVCRHSSVAIRTDSSKKMTDSKRNIPATHSRQIWGRAVYYSSAADGDVHATATATATATAQVQKPSLKLFASMLSIFECPW
jgi:hypothetical protein